ncbi:hypothetical protein [Bradyrhizobium liaoningense]|uniref:hypothetical protein n=1 Tax=Bradyrhizobium liaoningense TaxID=43992 RepID=UPI001BA4D6BE|nr:hypothetical protein [Bradyrhizobium liaoningense]MBR0823534.1 hypothetical protein [Bradyrhizobium liaoningense]
MLCLALGVLGVLILPPSLDLRFLEKQPVMGGEATADEIDKAERAPSLPPPRNPSVAVVEEYELARRKGTAEALELFIARHGDDPLAEKARADLQRLSR